MEKLFYSGFVGCSPATLEKRIPINSSVSSLYYLVPPLTALQAYYFFEERINGIGLIGMALAALGTLIVTRNSKIAAH